MHVSLEAALQREAHFIENPAHMKRLITLASQLRKRFPTEKYHIVGVGQSPAYVVKAMQYIEECITRNHSKNYQLVAHSRRHVEKDGDIFTIKNEHEVKRQLDIYQDYCEASGLSVQDIIDRFRESGKKTVFIDQVVSGCGLMTFLLSLCHTAKKMGCAPILSDAVEFVGLKIDGDDGDVQWSIQYQDALFSFVGRIKKIPKSFGNALAIDVEKDRLVPYIPISEIQRTLNFVLDPVAANLLKKLESTITQKFGKLCI